VENESQFHNVPPNSESHFKVTIVSDEFTGMPRLQRHRRLNQLLAQELAGTVHALALHTFCPTEWQQRNGELDPSPLCRGGSQTDA